MCQPVPCTTCGKTTWAGCGQHVDQVRAAVPAEQWCPGHPAAGPGKNLFQRVLGR
ncbi:hypothetical protein [Nocardia sp. BMG111209]|uniref:hypothetical protein n=1 Tax=Nocardia sp. BMG111209 TaxID=1160137 RepID=UPI00039DD8CB|nr:hypothetical protein [Nocardia sp. BMG111209]